MISLSSEMIPGTFVVNTNNSKWGIGQIQSSIGNKITVNFENVGKKVVNIKKINLQIIDIKK
tara:strand:- start:203 stop:388 length:186 start_codon:yes stop_codon:yes gene_type:complete